MSKPVVLLATGTRGDVQPYVALALALQERGIPVRLASDPAFQGWVSQYDLPFIPFDGNPSALMTQPGGQSALSYDGNILRSLDASLRYLRAARPVYRQMLRSAWTVCQGAGAVLVGLPTLWGAYIAEALGIPCIYALMQPFSRTAAFPCSLLPIQAPNWPPLNRFSYILVEQAIWLPWRGLIKQWLRSEVHFSPATFSTPAAGLYEKQAYVVYAFSPHIVPRPSDWPVTHRLTGFWFIDPPPAWRPTPDLEQFLAPGQPPVYIGFGSTGLRRKQAAIAAITRALEHTHVRAVIDLPRVDFPDSFDTRRVFFACGTPHSWLFARCSSAVHHGGAGTTAAALRAGIPSLVVPLAADQFFWANRVHSLGAGPQPIPQRSLDGAKLAAGLDQLVGVPALADQARHLSAAIQGENGARQAAAIIGACL